MNGPGETAGTAHSARVADDFPAPDLRIEGGTILTLGAGAEPIETGFVDVLGDQIIAAGTVGDRPATSPRRVIDASGSVVLPGLVDAHTHLFQVAARGLGDGLGLAEWLGTHMIPLALALRRTEMVALTELAATRLPHLVHNPISNAYLGSGTMRLTELRSSGVPLAAGSDGSAVAGQDMFTVARFGALLQRVAATDASVISVGDMIQLIAGGGARALGTGTGTIAPGERADLIVVNTSSLHHEPVNDPLATAGWFATGLDVSTVVVGGTPVLDEGSITTVDEAEVRARGREAARAVMARL